MKQGQMKIIIIYENDKYRNQIEYTFQTIFSILRLDYQILEYSQLQTEDINLRNALLISYGKEKLNIEASRQIHIYQSDFFSEPYQNKKLLPSQPLPRYKKIPIIYSGKGKVKNFIQETLNSIETNIDIIASSFFMLSRYEETINQKRDKYGRFPAYESLAYKEEFLSIPIVNEYARLLQQLLIKIGLHQPLKTTWPNNSKFAVCLTHDIDQVQTYNTINLLKKIALFLNGKVRPTKLLDYFKNFLLTCAHLKIDPSWNFNEIIEIESNYNFQSTFHFLVDNEFHNKFDIIYDIKSKRLTNLLWTLKKGGYEIALHGSPQASTNIELFSKQRSKLDHLVGNVFGNRFHYLFYEANKTPPLLENSKIHYDSTVGYPEHDGYRAGITLPYYLFDLQNNKQTNILEIPLVIMDTTLNTPRYKNLSLEEAWEICKYHLTLLEEYQGCFSILWHNSYFNESEFPGYKELYEKILFWIREHNGIGLREIDVYKYFNKTYMQG